MRFTVTWSEDAECRLAEIWLAASDRRTVTEATSRIDDELGRHADTVGEGRSATRRIFFVPPLAIEFRVSTDDRLATVFAVWQYPPQAPNK